MPLTKITTLFFRKLYDFSSTLDLKYFSDLFKNTCKPNQKYQRRTYPTSNYQLIFNNLHENLQSVDQFQAEKNGRCVQLKRKEPLLLPNLVIFSKETQVLLLHYFLSQLAIDRNTRSLTEAITFLTWFKIPFCSFTLFLF